MSINSAEVSLGRYKVWNVAWLKIKWWKCIFQTKLNIHLRHEIHVKASQISRHLLTDMIFHSITLVITLVWNHQGYMAAALLWLFENPENVGWIKATGSMKGLALFFRFAKLFCVANPVFSVKEWWKLQTKPMRKRLWMGTNVSCVSLVVLCDQSWATDSCLHRRDAYKDGFLPVKNGVKWGPYKWPYQWVTGGYIPTFALLIEVITPFKTGDAAPFNQTPVDFHSPPGTWGWYFAACLTLKKRELIFQIWR